MTSVPGLGGSAKLSVTDGADGGGGKAILSRSVSDILVNTAHLTKSLTKQIRPLADEKPRLMEITGRGFH